MAAETQQFQHWAAQCRLAATNMAVQHPPEFVTKLHRIDIYETALGLADIVGNEAASAHLDEIAHKLLEKSRLPELIFTPKPPAPPPPPPKKDPRRMCGWAILRLWEFWLGFAWGVTASAALALVILVARGH